MGRWSSGAVDTCCVYINMARGFKSLPTQPFNKEKSLELQDLLDNKNILELRKDPAKNKEIKDLEILGRLSMGVQGVLQHMLFDLNLLTRPPTFGEVLSITDMLYWSTQLAPHNVLLEYIKSLPENITLAKRADSGWGNA